MKQESLVEIVEDYFNSFNKALTRVIDLLIEDPSTAYPTMTQTVDDIFNILLGTSLVLIVMFFIIDYTAKSVLLEIVGYEVIAKLLLRLLIAKIIVENCRGLMLSLFFAMQDITRAIGLHGGSPLGDSVKNAILMKVYTMDGGWFGINYIMYYISLLPSLLIVWGVSILATVIVIARLFEIMIYSAIAPLPLSTLAGETTSGSSKSFIQSYIAVCLQGVIIVIAFKIFGGVVGDAYSGNTDLWMFIVLSIVFSITLMKSGTWARQIVGAM